MVWARGLVVRAEHEGVGLSRSWFATAERMGIEIRYGAAATELLQRRRGRVSGVRVRDDDGMPDARAPAVVLGCGGFEANVQMRTQHIGPLVGAAKVRGTPHNQGDGLRMAMAIGAMPWGQWSGCHATPISADWGNFAPRELTDRSNRLSYLYGVMINRKGRRFVDEGEDGAMFTYAKFGRAILAEPGAKAYQMFDCQVVHLLEPRYPTSKPITADTLEELIEQLDIDDKPQAMQDAATSTTPPRARGGRVRSDARRTGCPAQGLAPEKTNWAHQAREAAVLRLHRHRRHHLHLRRFEGGRDARGDRHRLAADPGPVWPAARWSAACSTTTIRPAPAWSRAPRSAGSPGAARQQPPKKSQREKQHERRICRQTAASRRLGASMSSPLTSVSSPKRSIARGEDLHPRHDRRDAGGLSRALHADPAQDPGRGYRARACADLRHGAAHQRAGCGAGQRHGVACARLRRLHRRHGRPSFGAAGLDLCWRWPRSAAVPAQDMSGGLCDRRRGRDPAGAAPSTFITTTRAGIRPRRSACSALRLPPVI